MSRPTAPPDPGDLRYRWPEDDPRFADSPALFWCSPPGAELDHVLVALPCGGSHGTPGSSHLFTHLLKAGTDSRSREELTRTLERTGTLVVPVTYPDASALRLTVPPSGRDDVAVVVSDMLQESTFPEEEVLREREKQAAIIANDLKDPGRLADRLLPLRLFGPTPYGRPVEGGVSDIERLTREEILCRHQSIDGRVAVFGCGPDPSAWMDLAEMGRAPFQPMPMSEPPRVQDPPDIALGIAGAVQSEIRVAYPIDEDTPTAAALILNSVFGGQFASRLNLVLREARGYTYGVRSSLVRRRHARFIRVTVAVDNEATLPALAIIDEEAARLGDEGITEAEHARAVQYLVGSMLRVQESPAGILRIRFASVMAGDPPTYLESYARMLRAESLDHINAAAPAIFRRPPGRALTGSPEVVDRLQRFSQPASNPFQ